MNSNISKVSVSLMEQAGFNAKIMKAERLKGDSSFNLPPGSFVNVIPLENLPGAPSTWVRESGSYVVPVDSEHGLWFDFTMNPAYTTGVILSIKGMNPITGQKIDDLKLEQYRNCCPLHKIPFGHDRYCEKCKYEWPGQNYLSYPNTLWWDGFRSEDGSVRQFFFTDEEMRDVASAVIGKQNTVPAFGFAFYRSKREIVKEKEIVRSNPYSYFGAYPLNAKGCFPKTPIWHILNDEKQNGEDLGDRQVTMDMIPDINQTYCCTNEMSFNNNPVKTSGFVRRMLQENTENKYVSIGAGAKIQQRLEIDTLPLDQWIAEPQAMIRLYFVFKDQLDTIVRNGGINIHEKIENGYLNGITVG